MDLFDRTEQSRTGAGEQAILVHLDLPDSMGREDLDEFHHLVTSSGVEPVAELTGKRDRPDPALFIGTGKADELAELVQQHQADVVLFNHSLSPAQERNLERAVKCRVLDRTGLILDIFAQRLAPTKGCCRLSWHSCAIYLPAWCAGGLTWKDKKAVLACAGLVKPSWKPTAVCCETAYVPLSLDWRRYESSERRGAVPGSVPKRR